MPLTVLGESDVRRLLLTLDQDEVLEMANNLAEALHEYSTGTQETTGCCSSNQPQRISIPAPKSRTTLFMPASTSTSRGIKIVSLEVSSGPSLPSPTASDKGSLHHSPSTASSITASIPSRSSTVSSHSSHTPSTPNTPSTSISNLSLRPSPSLKSTESTAPIGSLTLLTPFGTPYAIVSAEELTAFRTALASTLLFNKRQHVHNITVFGAGKQAYWHIRLALLLKGSAIHHIDIVNRSFDRAKSLMQEIYSDEWADIRHDKLKISILSSEYGEYTRLLKEHVRKADALFLCTSSIDPLFPAEHLTSSEGRKKGRYISAVGSYRPHMVELHPDILKQAVSPDHKHHHHKHAEKSGVIIVDSLESCMKEAGEIREAGLRPEQLVEVGELLMVKKAAMKEIEMGGEGEKGLKRWLESGNVIYKSVGLGLMDICVGEDIVGVAREKGLGTTIEGF
ncbi:MAG: hypothetical protein HETSPECPRED_002744 [Heterodermia speciosa]|uniref:NAD(P)-binding protein n=1 Tax=Heterodermia speciosa TaxID=116794 RepID=A0A8H3F0W7_9LECA|nr:MAG: hypothetical protein HETSPECPRED_002744 [Heterodermia speciosa]